MQARLHDRRPPVLRTHQSSSVIASAIRDRLRLLAESSCLDSLNSSYIACSNLLPSTYTLYTGLLALMKRQNNAKNGAIGFTAAHLNFSTQLRHIFPAFEHTDTHTS